MALDSFYSKSPEERARENGRAIDTQWTKENEVNEMIHQSGLQQIPGGIDQDLLEEVYAALKGEDATRISTKENITRLQGLKDSLEQTRKIEEARKEGDDMLAQMMRELDEEDVIQQQRAI